MTDFTDTAGNEKLKGGDGDDIFRMNGGGHDTVLAGNGDDLIFMYGAFDPKDRIDGGEGYDTVYLDGDYTDPIVLGAFNMAGVETLELSGGNYDVTLDGSLLAAGDIFSIGADGFLNLDATAESLGRVQVDLAGGWHGAILGGDGGLDVVSAYPLGHNQLFRGGAGFDTLTLNNFGMNLRLSAEQISGFETIILDGNGTYQLADDLVSAGQAVTIDANDAGPIIINGSAETDGAFHVLGGAFAAVTILGGHGDDTLQGGLSDDRITGGEGADVMTGLSGRDRFVFASLADSTTKAPDHIGDLNKEDVIDLGGIDADATKAGDQAFHLVSAFSGKAGEAMLQYKAHADETLLRLDVDGDGKADATIVLDGDHRDFHHFVL